MILAIETHKWQSCQDVSQGVGGCSSLQNEVVQSKMALWVVMRCRLWEGSSGTDGSSLEDLLGYHVYPVKHGRAPFLQGKLI